MGAHAALLVRAPTPTPTPFSILIPLVLILISITPPPCGADISEVDILLKFRASLNNGPSALSGWNASRKLCSTLEDPDHWEGIRCYNGSVWGMRLEGLGLSGSIDLDTLSSLSFLRTISFMNNAFQGPMPDIKKLYRLKAIYLSNNLFTGEIPDDAFLGMNYLKKIYLSNNDFSGKIPSSIITLPRLIALRLEGNKFEGLIPDLPQKHLSIVNLSNNKLSGSIPNTLSNFPASSFSGNQDLCGTPLDSCSIRKASIVLMILAVVAIVLIVVIIGLLLLILHRGSLSGKAGEAAVADSQGASEAAHSAPVERGTAEASSKRSEHGKLTFVRDDRERFDLTDLLRASAEVLGSGNFGSSYKAVLLSGEAMVAKRYKQMNNVGREEFQEHMRRLGRLAHPNLLPLVAYYYRREEKLLVSEYVENGSLASHLHGKLTYIHNS